MIAAAAALRLGRAVRYVEGRADNLASMQGRGLHFDVALHARRDGTIVGLEVDECCDAGAYPAAGSIEPGKTNLMACGPYRVPAVSFRARSVRTNLAPTGAYRGPGRSEAAAVLERTLDLLARDLGIDPAAIRARNLVTPAELPAESPTGAHYDDGDFPALLDELLEHAGYASTASRADASARGNPIRGPRHRDRDRRRLDCVVRAPGDRVRHRARRRHGARPHGHRIGRSAARARAYATLVAEVLPVSVDDVEVIEGDTELVEGSAGTSGSRSLQLAGSAVRGAALDVLEQARWLAAELLEAAVDDIVVDEDQFIVRGVPARGFTLAELGRATTADDSPIARRPLRVRPGRRDLHAQRAPVARRGRSRHRAGHAAPPRRGHRLRRASSTRRRPRVRSSARARRASGRRCSRSSSTTPPATRSPAACAEYLVPAASELPSIDARFVATEATRNPLGARGVGEIGMVAAPSAVHSAVLDAVAHLGVRHVDMPCTPERVWRAIRAARTIPTTTD